MTRNNTKWSICIRIHSLVILYPSRTICFRSCSMLLFFVLRAGPSSHCQRGGLAMPRSIVRIWVWFLGTMLIMHQPTNGKPAFWIYVFFQIVSVIYDRYNCLKKNKSDHNLPLKEWKKAGSQVVCTCCPNTRLNFRWRTVRLSGASQKCHFQPFFFCRNHFDIYGIELW